MHKTHSSKRVLLWATLIAVAIAVIAWKQPNVEALLGKFDIKAFSQSQSKVQMIASTTNNSTIQGIQKTYAASADKPIVLLPTFTLPKEFHEYAMIKMRLMTNDGKIITRSLTHFSKEKNNWAGYFSVPLPLGNYAVSVEAVCGMNVDGSLDKECYKVYPKPYIMKTSFQVL